MGTGQLVQPGDPRRLNKLLEGTERPSFVEYDDQVLKQYRRAYDDVMGKLRNPLNLHDTDGIGNFDLNSSEMEEIDEFLEPFSNEILPVIPLTADQQEEMKHEPKYDLDDLFSNKEESDD